MENSDKLGLMYDVLIQLPNSGGSQHGSSSISSSTRFSRSAAPKKHHHDVMDAEDIATFRKVLFSNFGPSPASLVKLASTTDDHLTGDGAHQAAGAVRSVGSSDEVAVEFALESPSAEATRPEDDALIGVDR